MSDDDLRRAASGDGDYNLERIGALIRRKSDARISRSFVISEVMRDPEVARAPTRELPTQPILVMR